MILFEKFGQHQPLNRQSERYARERIDLSVSTLADQVGACTTILQPLYALIEVHVLAAERLHGDDSVLQKHTESMIEMIWKSVRTGCGSDEGRPLGIDFQEYVSNHFKRLRLRGAVVSVEANCREYPKG